MNKQKIKKIAVNILKIIITVLIIYLITRKIDFKQLADILKSTNILYYIFAILLYAVSKIIAAFRLNIFLKNEQIIISPKYNLQLYWLGMYYNLLLPGGIGGDGYKIYMLRKQFGTKVKNLIFCFLFDRVNGLFALLCLALIIIPITSIPFDFKIYMPILIIWGFGIYYFGTSFFFPSYKKTLLKTTLLSFGVQITQLFVAFIILIALSEEKELADFLFVFLISSIVSVIPFTIGGIGSREITFLFASDILHLDVNISIALALMFYITTVVVSFSGIYYNLSPKFKHEKLKNKQT